MDLDEAETAANRGSRPMSRVRLGHADCDPALKYEPFRAPTLAHYIDIVRDPFLLAAVARTVAYTVPALGSELVFGIGIALLFNQAFWPYFGTRDLPVAHGCNAGCHQSGMVADVRSEPVELLPSTSASATERVGEQRMPCSIEPSMASTGQGVSARTGSVSTGALRRSTSSHEVATHSGVCQNMKGNRCLPHVLPALRCSRNMLAHPRSAAKEVAQFVMASAIACR